jgi:hypothetical protein
MNWQNRICEVHLMEMTQEVIPAHGLIAMIAQGSEDIVDKVHIIKGSFVVSSMFKTDLFD